MNQIDFSLYSKFPETQIHNSCIDQILPNETLLHTIWFLPFESLPEISLTCHSWRKIAYDSYWERIFCYTDHIYQPEKTNLTTAVKRLEPLFNSSDTEDKNKLSEFMKRCQKLNVTAQVNFIKNIFRSIRPIPITKRDSRFEKFLVNLFTHSLCPKACKLKIVDFVKSMRIPILDQFEWKDKPLKRGCKPKNHPFKLEIIPLDHALDIKIHKDHEFESGELVGVIDNCGLADGNSTLYFGKVKEKEGDLWRICLEEKSSGDGARITLKSSGEIGKFPQDKVLDIARVTL